MQLHAIVVEPILAARRAGARQLAERIGHALSQHEVDLDLGAVGHLDVVDAVEAVASNVDTIALGAASRDEGLVLECHGREGRVLDVGHERLVEVRAERELRRVVEDDAGLVERDGAVEPARVGPVLELSQLS